MPLPRNANVGSILRESRNGSVHLPAELWSSKFHRLINAVMRNVPLSIQFADYPNTVAYIRQLITYVHQYGKPKSDLSHQSQFIYRGTTIDFTIPNSYDESGFMSTTFDLDVANRFAGPGGTILRFHIRDLPPEARFAEINDSVVELAFESEVLCLPGKITVVDSETMTAMYVPDYSTIEAYLDDSQSGGGSSETLALHRAQSFLVPKLALSGKWVIFYRAIHERPVEVLGQTRLPTTDVEDHIVNYWIRIVTPAETRFESMTELIPEVQDLKREAFACDNLQRTRTLLQRMQSFQVHSAIYDRVTNRVEHLRYGEFPFMVKEMQVDESRNVEIANKIRSTYGV